METERHVFSVLAEDRVGLLRDATDAVYIAGANIDHIRQSVVGGFFSLVFTADFPKGADIAKTVEELRGKEGVRNVAAVPVPEKMRIPAPPIGSVFIAMTSGPDKPGTIRAISGFMVQRGVSIQDWTVTPEGGEVVYIAKVVVPESSDFRLLQSDFKKEMSEVGLKAMLCHENIFRATSQIGPIKALLDNGK